MSRNPRGKDLTCIYTDERPDLARELPNWMFDENYCAGMGLGPPQVSIEALNEAIQSGVAGGHETLQHGIPQIAQLSNGSVDLQNTYIKVRNSWSTQFGLNGDYLLWHSIATELLASISDAERDAVFGGNAAAFYRL